MTLAPTVSTGSTTKGRLVDQFERGLDAPICLTWELTYACNLACVHCLSSSGRRDPDELTYSNALVLCCGATEEEVRRRADAIGRSTDDLRENGLAGSPAEVVDRIGQFAALGARRIYLQTLDLDDLEHLELVAAEVMPQL